MNDIFDYLTWRGDLSFKVSPFNEADNIIFNLLTYIDFEGIVPHSFRKSITMRSAAEADFSRQLNPDTRLYKLLNACADCRRFADVRLTGCWDDFSTNEVRQFAAITFIYDTGSAYVSYRGTDTTLTGWKEDFSMAFLAPVPSQTMGLTYFETLMKELPWWNRRKCIILGGHSKGGNVAQYAAAYSKKRYQNAISAIYSNDGPGFDDSMYEAHRFQPLVSRMKTFVPQSSVIGRLFEHLEEETVIYSRENGIMSHDEFTWGITGTTLERISSDIPVTSNVSRIFMKWMNSVPVDERKQFIEGTFSLLEDMGFTTMQDMSNFTMGQGLTLIRKINRLDQESRRCLTHVLTELLKSYRK